MWWERQVPVTNGFSDFANDPNSGLARHMGWVAAVAVNCIIIIIL
jgi:hypothetical protein